MSSFSNAALPFIGDSGPKALPGQPANMNVGVTVGKFRGKLTARTDANYLVEVAPEDLQPKPMYTYTNLVPSAKVRQGR